MAKKWGKSLMNVPLAYPIMDDGTNFFSCKQFSKHMWPNFCSHNPKVEADRYFNVSLYDQMYRDIHDCDCFWRIYYADGKTAFVCKRGSGWKTLHSWPKMVFGEKEVRSSRKNTHIINPPTTNQPPLDRRALIRGIARPAVLRREKGGHCTDGMAGP